MTLVAPLVKSPVLVLWGEKDGLLDLSHQEKLEKAYPDAVFRIFTGAGHNMFWEFPDKAASLINEFLDIEPRARYKSSRKHSSVTRLRGNGAVPNAAAVAQIKTAGQARRQYDQPAKSLTKQRLPRPGLPPEQRWWLRSLQRHRPAPS